MTISLAVDLSEAARTCSNYEYRALLKDAHMNLLDLIDEFTLGPSDEGLRALNGAWASAARILKNTPPEGTPGPVSGAPEPATLAA